MGGKNTYLGRPRRRLVVACAAAATLALTATVARAVDPLPIQEIPESTAWQWVGGAKFDQRAAPAASVTPHEADLYSVRFRKRTQGIAGGDICKDRIDPAAYAQDADFVRALEECERVPVIYRFEDGEWSESYRGETPGFVAAVAWINFKMALAVGGTGTYPRREHARIGEESYEEWVARDPAGEPRAWLFKDGEWSEIGDLPAEMTALSALDVWSGRTSSGADYGVAGGIGQLWEWRDGRFTGKVIDRDSTSAGPGVQPGPGTERAFPSDGNAYERALLAGTLPDGAVSRPANFIYRVSRIRFAPDRRQTAILAYTRGCCGFDVEAGNSDDGLPLLESDTGPENGSRLIVFDPYTLTDENIDGGGYQSTSTSVNLQQRPHWSVTRGDGDSVQAFGLHGVIYNGNLEGNPDEPEQGSPRWVRGQLVSASARPEDEVGAPEADLRYVAADGDGELRPDSQYGPRPTGNGAPDWKVGARLSSDAGLGPRGVIAHGGTGTGYAAGTGPTYNDDVDWQLASGYGLNSISMLDADGDGWAVGDRGAIVHLEAPVVEPPPPELGNRTTVKLTENAYDPFRRPAATRVGPVPSLSARPRLDLDRPVLESAGSPIGQDVRQIVMSRDGSEGWALAPTVKAGGPVRFSLRNSLYHYSAGVWSRCDPTGVPGISAPDPACAGLGPLVDYRNKAVGGGDDFIRLFTMARVPYERDADPTNDDEFELLAIGSRYEDPAGRTAPKGGLHLMLRYRHGRWRLESEELRRSFCAAVYRPSPTTGCLTPAGAPPNQVEQGASKLQPNPAALVFAAPDDAWFLGEVTPGNTQRTLVHFDGERWTGCALASNVNLVPPTNAYAANAATCGDPDKLLSGLEGASQFNFPVIGQTLAEAGGRVYLAGNRGGTVGQQQGPPVILYKDPGVPWRSQGGGYDLGADPENSSPGMIYSVAVARGPGGFEGWALADVNRGVVVPALGTRASVAPPPVLLRLAPGEETWEFHDQPDAARDYILGSTLGTNSSADPALVMPESQLTLPGRDGRSGEAFFSRTPPGRAGDVPGQPFLAFNPDHERWQLFESDQLNFHFIATERRPNTLAPDGQGGAWIGAGEGSNTGLGTDAQTGNFRRNHFLHYTRHPYAPVFTEAPSPLGEAAASGPRIGSQADTGMTALAGSADGTVWLASREGLFRYERLSGGWERAVVPGWIRRLPAGVALGADATANALAVEPGGAGIAVGNGGRIADIDPAGIRLNAAAGRSCAALGLASGCGTTEDLHATAIAPGGAAIVGGENRALAWRPGGGEFGAIARPPARLTATITGLSMPAPPGGGEPQRAWATTDQGDVFVGERPGAGWRWKAEAVDEFADPIAIDAKGNPLSVEAIALDSSGHGYAVGEDGLVLERTGGELPWRRLNVHTEEDLTAVTLPAGGGDGALIGGRGGLLLTFAGGEFQVARHAESLRPPTGEVTGIALLPGVEDGQVEAWAAVSGGSFRYGDSQLLHYSSHPDETLLDPAARGTRALPDSPAPVDGELSFAALGRSDCHIDGFNSVCYEMFGQGSLRDVVVRRVRDELIARSGQPDGPLFALHTGDTNDSGGATGQRAMGDLGGDRAELVTLFAGNLAALVSATRKYRRVNEQMLDPLTDAGLPLFSATGPRDLSESRVCDIGVSGECANNRDQARIGENHAWRQTMLDKPSPWGHGEPVTAVDGGEEIRFEPIGLRADEPQNIDVEISDEAGLPRPRLATGGARTHYAFDVVKGDRKIARVVTLDTSAGSTSASETVAHPPEGTAGQTGWLEGMLCFEDQAGAAERGCSRERDQRAIVLTATPTYSYGPGAITDTNVIDGIQLEQLLSLYEVDTVVSGRLGWNGLFWTIGPGLHEPCPGGEYPAGPPRSAAPDCTGSLPQNPTGGLTRPIPTVIANTAGGRFGPDGRGNGSGSDGYWRGYTIVRLPPDRDTRKTIVEQRPILDWIRLTSANGNRIVRPRAKLVLRGFSGAPIGSAGDPNGGRRLEIVDTPAVTHRYDLLLADPERPWLPKADDGSDPEVPNAASRRVGEQDPCGPYVCLDPKIGTIDEQSGRVRAGLGNYPRTFAVGMLSVGHRSAIYPLVFEPSAAYRPQPPIAPAPPPPPPPAPAPPVGNPSPPAVDPPLPPIVPQSELPLPLAPPAPPSPPAYGQGTPIGLELSPAVLLAPPPTVVLQPPNPLVQPAPPSGARREARQRQAATQKSGADGAEQGAEVQEMGGDMANTPPSPEQSMSRHDFTPLPRAEQPSAWARDALIGGGLGITALVLALGLSGARPTPRRREPEVPAPALVRARRR